VRQRLDIGCNFPGLPPQGVNVVAVHPGATRTERTGDEDAARAARGNTIGRIVDTFTPDECANYFAAAGYDAD